MKQFRSEQPADSSSSAVKKRGLSEHGTRIKELVGPFLMHRQEAPAPSQTNQGMDKDKGGDRSFGQV